MSGNPRVVHLNDIAHIGRTLADGLGAQGFAATLLDPPRFGVGRSQPRRLLAAPARLRALLAAAVAARRMRPDLVHVHYARFGWMAAIAGRPYLVHCHGTDIRGVSPASAWGRLVAPWLRGARRVLFSTPDLEPWVSAFRPDAEFLPHPIAVPEPVEPNARRDVLVGVRLDPIKGPESIAATLARLLELRPATTITVVAHGSARRAVLDAVGGRAEVIPPVLHDAMPALLGVHRLAIGQMLVGALGAYELEAMASGLPVAAAFHFPEAYDATPPVIAGASPVETARQLAALLDDELRIGEAGRASREWVIAHHAAPSVVRTLAGIYRDLLAGHP